MPYQPPPAQRVTQLLTSDYEAMLSWINMQEGVIADLEAEIERLKTPPLKTLVLDKTRVHNLAGLTLENGLVEPDDKQYEAMRTAMRQAAGMGFNAARWFMNPDEVSDHLAGLLRPESHLPNYARSLGLAYIADTVDAVVWKSFVKEDAPGTTVQQIAIIRQELRNYLEGLMKLARAFVVNDANTYRDASKFPARTLERIVERIRSIAPAMPLIASLTGNAVIADYKPLFDHVEAQTFGKSSELAGFFAKPFDIFCLDGRKGVSLTYVQAMRNLMLKAKVDNFFVYANTITDWQQSSMTEQVKVITEMVNARQAGG